MLTQEKIITKIITQNLEYTGQWYEDKWHYTPINIPHALELFNVTYYILKELDINITELCVSWDNSLLLTAKNQIYTFYIDICLGYNPDDLDDIEYAITVMNTELVGHISTIREKLKESLTKFKI